MEISNKRKKFLLYGLVCNLISVAVQGFLVVQHYNLKLGLSTGKSFCNINSTFNCDAVAVSAYSSIAGIPLAMLGLFAHAVLIFLLASAWLEVSLNPRRVLRLSLLLSALIALTSVVMGSISTLILGTYCIYCMAAYALSFINVTLIWKAQEDKPGSNFLADVKSLVADHRWATILLVLIPGLSFVGHSLYLADYGGSAKIQESIRDSISEWTGSASFDFNSENSMTYQKGSSKPVMIIVEFADYLCSHCRAAYPSLHNFTDSRPDVQLQFKAFPLDGTCNKAIERKGDGLRCKLAYLSHCAEKISKKGWDAHHWIFDRQDRLLSGLSFETVFKELTEEFHLDSQAVKACIDQDATIEAIANQAWEGAAAKIAGTPSVFINGKKMERGQFPPLLEKIYQTLKSQ